ncbi:MAG: ABC transporter, partial [Bacteroidetes bacterium]|nr:ABC transporter [Bacteroidota bacterium]
NEQDLFEGTLYENITLGRTEITIENILALTKKLGFENFISYFPLSFNSIIDPLGKTLPTSISKKILLLRALIHNPILLALEEPWSGLDEHVKENLQAYLFEASKTKTIIVTTNDNDFAEKCTKQFHLTNDNAIVKK